METICEHCNKVTKVTRLKPVKDTTSKEVIIKYTELFMGKFGVEPEINWAACMLATKKLLKSRTKEALYKKLEEFISSENQFFKQSGYRYLMFPIWLQQDTVNSVNKPVENKKQWDGLL